MAICTISVTTIFALFSSSYFLSATIAQLNIIVITKVFGFAQRLMVCWFACEANFKMAIIACGTSYLLRSTFQAILYGIVKFPFLAPTKITMIDLLAIAANMIITFPAFFSTIDLMWTFIAKLFCLIQNKRIMIIWAFNFAFLKGIRTLAWIFLDDPLACGG